MSDYTFGNDFSVKDGLASGDPNKLILGSDMDSEFEAIETHIASKVDEPTNPEDGEVLQWDDNTSAVTWGRGLPIGFIGAYGGSSDPTDWLLCDGREVVRVGTYAALFAVTGTSFGVGDGSTTFNVPDMRMRVPVGPDDMGTAEGAASRDTGVTYDSGSGGVGSEGGESASSDIPDHTHGVGTLATASAGSHSHTYERSTTDNGDNALTPDSNGLTGETGTTSTAPDHTHTITGDTASAGNGATVERMQPYQVANWIIKYR